MKLKSPHLADQLKTAPILLQIIVEEFVAHSLQMGIMPVLTRVTDAVEGESGVHLDHRAVDFRDEHGGKFLYDRIQREWLIEKLNTRFRRNDGKKTVIWHSFGGGPHHFHIQIATLTKTYMDVKTDKVQNGH